MLYCASHAFFSRPESGVFCMTDDDFVRVVVDKGRRKKEKRRRNEFVIGEKLIRIIFRPIKPLDTFFRSDLNYFFSFVSLRLFSYLKTP